MHSPTTKSYTAPLTVRNNEIDTMFRTTGTIKRTRISAGTRNTPPPLSLPTGPDSSRYRFRDVNAAPRYPARTKDHRGCRALVRHAYKNVTESEHTG